MFSGDPLSSFPGPPVSPGASGSLVPTQTSSHPLQAASPQSNQAESPTSSPLDPASAVRLRRPTSGIDEPTTLDGLRQLARQGSWRAIAERARVPPGVGGAVDVQQKLAFQAYLVLALMKLRMYGAAADEIRAIGDLDSPSLRYEAHPDLYPGKTGSLVPFALRWLHADLPYRLGQPSVTLDRLYALLARCNDKLDELVPPGARLAGVGGLSFRKGVPHGELLAGGVPPPDHWLESSGPVPSLTDRLRGGDGDVGNLVGGAADGRSGGRGTSMDTEFGDFTSAPAPLPSSGLAPTRSSSFGGDSVEFGEFAAAPPTPTAQQALEVDLLSGSPLPQAAAHPSHHPAAGADTAVTWGAGVQPNGAITPGLGAATAPGLDAAMGQSLDGGIALWSDSVVTSEIGGASASEPDSVMASEPGVGIHDRLSLDELAALMGDGSMGSPRSEKGRSPEQGGGGAFELVRGGRGPLGGSEGSLASEEGLGGGAVSGTPGAASATLPGGGECPAELLGKGAGAGAGAGPESLLVDGGGVGEDPPVGGTVLPGGMEGTLFSGGVTGGGSAVSDLLTGGDVTEERVEGGGSAPEELRLGTEVGPTRPQAPPASSSGQVGASLLDVLATPLVSGTAVMMMEAGGGATSLEGTVTDQTTAPLSVSDTLGGEAMPPTLGSVAATLGEVPMAGASVQGAGGGEGGREGSKGKMDAVVRRESDGVAQEATAEWGQAGGVDPVVGGTTVGRAGGEKEDPLEGFSVEETQGPIEDCVPAVTIWRERQEMVLFFILNHHLQHKDAMVALRWLDALLRKRPSDPVIWSKVAYILLQVGDVDSARMAFAHVESILAADPNPAARALARSNRGLQLFVLKDYPGAVREWDAVLAEEPWNAAAANNKALCLMYSRDLMAAIRVLEDCLHRYPLQTLNETLILNLASMYELASSNSTDSKRALSSWISRIAPDDFDLMCTRL